MVRRSKDKPVIIKENFFGGEGRIVLNSFITGNDELYDKGRVFARTVIEPGSSLGYHMHQGDEEIFYILSGEGIFNDNGVEYDIQVGDVYITRDGESHGIVNTGTENIEMIALVLFKD